MYILTYLYTKYILRIVIIQRIIQRIVQPNRNIELQFMFHQYIHDAVVGKRRKTHNVLWSKLMLQYQYTHTVDDKGGYMSHDLY